MFAVRKGRGHGESGLFSWEIWAPIEWESVRGWVTHVFSSLVLAFRLIFVLGVCDCV